MSWRRIGNQCRHRWCSACDDEPACCQGRQRLPFRTDSISICTASSWRTTANGSSSSKGMNGDRRQAQRYRLAIRRTTSFSTLRMRQSRDETRAGSSISPIGAPTDHVQASSICWPRLGPDRIVREVALLEASPTAAAENHTQPMLPAPRSCRHIMMSARPIVNMRRLRNLAAAADRRRGGFRGPAADARRWCKNGQGIGDGCRSRARRTLPASPIPPGFRWRMAGKDRHPFPVPLKVCDETSQRR